MITKIGKAVVTPYFKSPEDFVSFADRYGLDRTVRNYDTDFDWDTGKTYVTDEYDEVPNVTKDDVDEMNRRIMYGNMINAYGLAPSQARALSDNDYLFNRISRGMPIDEFRVPDVVIHKAPSKERRNINTAIGAAVGAGLGAFPGASVKNIKGALIGGALGSLAGGAIARAATPTKDRRDRGVDAVRSGYPKLLAAYKPTEN